MKKLLVYLLISILTISVNFAAENAAPNVLVLVEGDYNTKNIPSAQGREVAQLLGHFSANVSLNGLNNYKKGDVNRYDFIFYVGSTTSAKISDEFLADAYATRKTLVWINAGFDALSKKFDTDSKFGFSVSQLDRTNNWCIVKAEKITYTKGAGEINPVIIKDKKTVEVWATAQLAKGKKETPYMVKSGNLIYVADMPFTGATETDRYLLFCDKLHDILGIKHSELHQAIIRIEDVTPLNNPDKLREVADILAERGIPFMVGVVPFYVNPTEDRRVSLTDRPELVDALKYMVKNGGNIVMHGVTHQYKGISTDDGEFWNVMQAKPIPDENEEDISRKIESGIDEFYKNGLYPIMWETPHYVASQKSYKVFTKYFSSCIEQRMVIDNFDYGQFFPFTIQKDIFGQRIYPENMGYIPLKPRVDSSMVYVDRIIKNADMLHTVRDGIVSFFYHPFLDSKLLVSLVDGIKAKGFTFIDLGTEKNWVKAPNKTILTGSQTLDMNIDNSFLHEMYIDNSGNITKKIFSKDRIKGKVSKNIELQPGEMYVAEGLEFYVKEPTFKDKIIQKTRSTWNELFGEKNWHEARVCVLWNPSARGAAYFDQSSFISIFKSINVNADTLFLNQELNLKKYNLLVVPYASVDSLSESEKEAVVRYVKAGGNLITDRKNKLIEKLGVKFLNSEMKVHQIRDSYYPQEFITWKYSQLANKFEFSESDESFCEDISTGLPIVIGKEFGKGKIIYFNTAFDANSPHGYSNYPFALEYIKRYFKLSPVFKRENLEVYFDPGHRQNTSAENLIKLWVKQGIRIVHVAGWHQYPKYDYDYKRLVKLAHANGLLMYAWIEPPQVSPKFWQNHPEWHEKNYKGQDIGKDVSPSWRVPVALTDERCFRAAMDEYIKFLSENEWDGVNIAELYFEAGRGFEQPNLFTPMHPSAIAEFKARNGFDMKLIFDSTSTYYWKRNPQAKASVINYRVDKITSLHDRILKTVTDFAKTRPGFGVMVTFMDTYFSPEIREYHGISSDRMLEMQKKYGVILQPEDPQSKWSTDPTRYTEFANFYAQKMSDPSKLLVDLNILSFRQRDEVTPFPTLIQTGIESYHLVNSAAIGAPRFSIYSEASCNPQDFNYFTYASSGPVKYQYTESGYKVSSPYSFVLQLPKNFRVISIDGQTVIGYRENDFLIPAGNHEINLHTSDFQGFSTVEIQAQILSFTGNLLDFKYDMQKANFTYESLERAWMTFNAKPTAMKIDGRDTSVVALNGNDCFSILLPAGKHSVEVSTGDKFSNGMNITSLWSISAIAIYGTLGVIMLFIMYFGLKIFRRRLEN